MVESNNHLSVERKGRIATVVIDRPKALNALNRAILEELEETVSRLTSEDIRAIIITGTGERAFSAGADLDELAGLNAREAYEALSTGQRTMSALDASPVPIIAAVNGLALGGGFELILACTFPVMAEHAALGLPESGLGLIPGYGGTQRLTAMVGKSAAAHAMLTGTRLTAQRCYELGITPVPPVAAADLMPTAMKTAEAVASKGPGAQSAILAALATSRPRAQDLAFEAALAGISTGSAEATEGIAAFREKRVPDFTGSKGK
jgi:enoyl-CoA hydratase